LNEIIVFFLKAIRRVKKLRHMHFGYDPEPRAKRSRWSPPDKRTLIPNVACILPPDLTPDILHAFLLRFQLEEVEYKLANLEAEHVNVNFTENPLSRFDSESRFSVPPDVRARDALCQERRQVLASIDRMYPIFRPPVSLGLSVKKCVKKLPIPSEKAIGSVVGNRGATVKSLEKEFNVRISFRGSSIAYDPDRPSEEQPHILIIGTKEEDADRCFKKLSQIINSEPAPIAPDDTPYELLRFDPAEEVHPWGAVEPVAALIADSEVDHAVEDLMKELRHGGRSAEESESAARAAVWRKFEAVDLTLRDVSIVVAEPPPPGT
jgi:hypothetical protein